MLVRRMGRPGLLSTVSRSSVIAGTPTAVINALDHHSVGMLRHHASADAADRELVGQLGRLAGLHTDGALSDEEFEAAKRRLLG